MSVEIIVPDNAVLISRTDTKGVITYTSKDFQKISGYTEQELLKKSHNIVRHPDMPREVFKEMWSVLKSGHVWTGLIKNRCKSGDFYWVEATVTPVREMNTNIGYVSVRKKPLRKDVANAESLYASINKDQPQTSFFGTV